MNDKQKLAKAKKVISRTLLSNILLCLFKLAIGLIGKSQALIADAAHSLSDSATDIVVILGFSLSCKPKDKSHPYGHGKFETIAAAITGIFLLGLVFKIGHYALKSLFTGSFVRPAGITLAAAITSIIIKEWLYRYNLSFANKTNSSAFMANAWHHRSDAFSSIAVLTGIIAARAGFPVFDPLAAIVVSLFILKISFEIIKLSVMELVESSIDPATITQIRQITRAKKEVISVHGIKARKMGPKIVAELHLVLNADIKLSDAHAIAEKVEKDIISRIKNIDEVLIHIDPNKKP